MHVILGLIYNTVLGVFRVILLIYDCLFQAEIFREFGGMVLANACGPCIGQWKR